MVREDKLSWLFREVSGSWLVQRWLQRWEKVRSWLFCPPSPRAHSASGHSMPFRSIWLAAMSMTLMINAIAKAQIKLFLTHVCRFFFFGWTRVNQTKWKGQKFRNIKNSLVTCSSGTPDTHLRSPNTCYIFSTQGNGHKFIVNAASEEAFVPLYSTLKRLNFTGNVPLLKVSSAARRKDDWFLYGITVTHFSPPFCDGKQIRMKRRLACFADRFPDPDHRVFPAQTR